jgi:hypothetical protein
MRPPFFALCAALTAGALAQPLATAQTQAQAESFIRTTYQKYGIKASTGIAFTGHNANAVFSPLLLKLIRRDQKQFRGEVGKLDGDPICDCQDSEGLRLTEVRVSKTSEHTAVASVSLLFPSDSSVRNLRLQLIWLPEGWRIDDIDTTDTPSLRKLLQ